MLAGQSIACDFADFYPFPYRLGSNWVAFFLANGGSVASYSNLAICGLVDLKSTAKWPTGLFSTLKPVQIRGRSPP